MGFFAGGDVAALSWGARDEGAAPHAPSAERHMREMTATKRFISLPIKEEIDRIYCVGVTIDQNNIGNRRSRDDEELVVKMSIPRRDPRIGAGSQRASRPRNGCASSRT